MTDDELVSKWVQAMACFSTTKHPSWEIGVKDLEKELYRRRLGLKRFNVRIAQQEETIKHIDSLLDPLPRDSK